MQGRRCLTVSEKRKSAAPDGCDIKGGRGKRNATRDETLTKNNLNTHSGACRVRISDLLQRGSANGLTLSDLERLTGLEGREIRRRINRERRDVTLIMADNIHGYFLPESGDDVRRFIRSMSSRAKEIVAVCRAAEDALIKSEGQETVEGW